MDFSKALPPSNGGNSGGLSAFGSSEPAPEYKPLPPGIYSARVKSGEFTSTKTGSDAYKMRFEIAEGEQAGKTVQRIWTITPKSATYVRRDLLPFGLTTPEQLLSPFPELGKEYFVRLVVALQRSDIGTEYNDIKKIDLIRIENGPLSGFGLPEGEGG